MKKIIALLLVLAMATALFAGCGNQTADPTEGTDGTEASQPAGNDAAKELDNARAFLKNMYKDSNGTQTKRDYTVVSVVSIGSNTYNVEWSIEVTAGDASCVAVSSDGAIATVKILNSEPTEEVRYNLVGTITSGSETVSVSFSHYIEAAKATGVVFDKAPTVGTAYKFAVEQNEVGSTLYFTGNMSGYYMESTENPFEAADVYLEEVDGGLRLYFNDAEGVKTYVDLVPREGNAEKANIVLTTEPTCVYTWDSERGTLVSTLGEHKFYIGCYSSYTTFSVSNFSYIEDASVVGVSQYPAGLATVNIVPTKVPSPVADTAYKFVVEQVEAGATIYFTGVMSGYYMATTQNPGEAVDVYLEEVEGGLRLYFLQGESKVYIDLIPREGNAEKANIVLTAEPTCVYTWDSERGTLVSVLGEHSFYIGCYSTYTTFSVSNFSYISDASVVGVSQFPSGFCTVEGFMGVNLPASDEQTPDDGNNDNDNNNTSSDPAADSKLSISEAIALGTSKEHNTYTEGKYYVTGVITEVYNDTYGNMYITDGNGNTLTIYGTYDANGTNRYDAMATKPVAGDTVTIYGIVGQYNGTPQIKNGWITAHTPAGGSSSDTPETGDPAANSTLTISEAIALGTSKEHNTYTEGKYYVTGVITEVYNTTYGNMYITDGNGNTLTIYGTYSDDGADRYDAMSVKPVAGDTVTIYGVIGQYNGTPQIKNGWITAHTSASGSGSNEDDTPAVSDEYVTDPQVGTAYKMGMYQESKGEVYYLAGGMSGYYMATTNNASEAVDVYLETTDGGYYMYYMDGSSKVYIDIQISGTHINAVQAATPGVVFVYDTEYNTMVATIDGTQYYLGTYGSYVTIGASDYVKYVATSYPIHFYN